MWRARLEGHLRFWDMNLTTWQVLWFLHQEDVRYSQHMLASRLGIETSHLVRLLDRMEKRGLLKREVNFQDRRQNHVVITPAGVALVGEVEATIIQLRKEMLTDVATDDLEQGILLLEWMLRNFVRMGETKQPSQSVEARTPPADRHGSVERRNNADRRGNADRRRDTLSAERYSKDLDRRSHMERRKLDRRRRISSR
jgi:MarR family transcriptional regulator for hemolysin